MRIFIKKGDYSICVECPYKSPMEWEQGFDDAYNKTGFDGTKRMSKVYCCGYKTGLEILEFAKEEEKWRKRERG